MNFRKFISGVSALTIAAGSFAAMAVTASAETVNYTPVYSNDFAAEDAAFDAATWGKSSSKYLSYAQIGRGSTGAVADGEYVWTADIIKSGDNGYLYNATVGTLTNAITTATAKDYQLKFDVTLNETGNGTDRTAIELVNNNNAVVLGLVLNHSRKSSSSGSYTVGYYTGGDWGVKVKSDSVTDSKRANAEGTLGANAATAAQIASGNGTTASVKYNVELNYTAETGAATLTIKDSADNAVVDNAALTLDAETGLKYIYMTGAVWYQKAVSNIHIDNFSINNTAITYDITATGDENVTITPSVETIAAGETVTYDVELTEGYTADVTVVDAEGNAVEVTEKSFTMPASDVTITAVSREIGSYSYTVNAVAGGAVIEELATGTAKEGDAYDVTNLAEVIKAEDGKFYQLSDNDVKNYAKSFTMGAANAAETVTYVEDSTIKYFTDAAEATWKGTADGISGGNYGSWGNKANILSYTAESGEYDVIIKVHSKGGSGSNYRKAAVALDGSEADKIDANGNGVKTLHVSVPEAGGTITAYGLGTNKATDNIDYVIIKRTGDYVAPAVANIGIELGDAEVVNGTEDYAAEVASVYVATVTNSGTAEGEATKITISVDDKAPQSKDVSITLGADASAFIGIILNNVNANSQAVSATVDFE